MKTLDQYKGKIDRVMHDEPPLSVMQIIAIVIISAIIIVPIAGSIAQWAIDHIK